MFSKTIIVGHLDTYPELRYTSGGQSVCSFFRSRPPELD